MFCIKVINQIEYLQSTGENIGLLSLAWYRLICLKIIFELTLFYIFIDILKIGPINLFCQLFIWTVTLNSIFDLVKPILNDFDCLEETEAWTLVGLSPLIFGWAGSVLLNLLFYWVCQKLIDMTSLLESNDYGTDCRIIHSNNFSNLACRQAMLLT